MMTPPSNARRHAATVAIGLILALGGCSQYIDPNVPEPIRPFSEPETGKDYLLYRPSSYDRKQAWPLIVVCHAAWPDSPNRQIRDWNELAEERGFLVVAPHLSGTRKGLTETTEDRQSLRRADEELILATIRHVRAGHNVSRDRIFLSGYAGGAYIALPLALRHAEVFRALALADPKFDEEHLTADPKPLDTELPIYVYYSVSDVVRGKHARRLLDWLRQRHASVREDSSGTGRRGHARRAVAFFDEVLRKQPRQPRQGD